MMLQKATKLIDSAHPTNVFKRGRITPFEYHLVAMGGPQVVASYLKHLNKCKQVLDDMAQSPRYQKVSLVACPFMPSHP